MNTPTTIDLDTFALERGVAAQARKWLYAYGLTSIIGGVFSLFQPRVAGLTFEAIVAFLLLAVGMLQIFTALESRGRARKILFLLGLAEVLTGVLILIFPFTALLTITIYLGSIFILQAVGRFALLRTMGGPARNTSLVLSAIGSLFAGLLILSHIHESSSWALGVLCGVSLLLTGLSAIFVARNWSQLAPKFP